MSYIVSFEFRVLVFMDEYTLGNGKNGKLMDRSIDPRRSGDMLPSSRRRCGAVSAIPVGTTG
jgi:hypothetical protein